MKKIITAVLVLLALLYLTYLSIILTINYQGVYQKLHSQIAKAGYDAQISSIEVVRFPVPRIDLRDMSIPNLLYAKKLEVNFSLLSILMLNPVISEINIHNVNIIAPKNKLDFVGHETMMVSIMNIVPKLPKILANNISLVDRITKNINQHIDDIVIDHTSSDKQLIINWDKKNKTNIAYKNTSAGVKVHLDSVSESYTLELNELYSKEKLQNGSLKYSINNLQKFVTETYQDLDLLITKIQSPEAAELLCDIDVKDKRISISNIKLNSKSIAMSGSMDIYRSEKPDSINLSFDLIDLKTLLATPNRNLVNESKSKDKMGLGNIVRNINITAKKIILAEAELKDAVFNASINNNTLNITQLSANMMDEGVFNISGIVTQNQYRSMFEGIINIKHNDANMILSKLGFAHLTTTTPTNFVLKSDIKATPIDYQLNNLFMKLGSFNAGGNAAIKFIGQTPRVNLTLSLSSIDLLKTEYPVLSKLITYLRSLTTDMHSKEYLKKYIPLREIDYFGNFDISFTDLDIGDTQIDKLRIITDVASGNVTLNSVYYQDGENYVSGAGYIAASGIKPSLGIKISEAMIQTSSFDVPHILQFFQTMQNEYDLKKINIITEITMQNIQQNEKIFKNLVFNAKNDGILWNISALNGKFSSGKFSSSGSLRMDSMDLNLAYAFNNFNLKEINNFIPLELFGIDNGWMSINGMISTNGSNIDQLFYNLYSKSSIISKGVKWNNFDIDSVIALIDNTQYSSSKLDSDVPRFMNTGNTVMKTLSGDMVLNHGVFKFSNIKFDTNRSSNTSAAEYNMYNNKLRIASNFSFTPPSVDAYSSPNPIPFSMEVGPDILNPKKTFDLTGFKAFLDQRTSLRSWYTPQNVPINREAQENPATSPNNENSSLNNSNDSVGSSGTNSQRFVQ